MQKFPISLFLSLLLLLLLHSCQQNNPEQLETEKESTTGFREMVNAGKYRTLDTLYAPNGADMILVYEKLEPGLPEGMRKIYSAVVRAEDLQGNIDHLSFSHDTIEDLQWAGYGAIRLRENYMGVHRYKKSHFPRSQFSLNGQKINVISTNPLNGEFERKILMERVSADGKMRIVSYMYFHPQQNEEKLQISVLGVNDSLPLLGNFYSSTSREWDCIKNLGWKDEKSIYLHLHPHCMDNVEDYLNADRPDYQLEKLEYSPKDY